MIDEQYKDIALNNVSILDVLRFIEKDKGCDFNIQDSGSTMNLRCPDEVLYPEETVHETDSTTKTTISLERNIIRCWNPACKLGTKNTISLIQFAYKEDDLKFPQAIKKVLDIGGIPYEEEATELSEEAKISILKTNYANEKAQNLMLGYDLITENKIPTGGDEILYIDAAKYLISRGITKDIARKLKFGIGGGKSNVLRKADINLLKKAKIYSTKKSYEIMNKRIVIPNILKGYVVGTTGRAIYDDESTRYLNVGEVNNLINIDKAKEYDTIYMFEGALNAASYIEITELDNVMALQGASSFQQRFLSLIVSEKTKFKDNTEFIYVADCDESGLFAAKKLGLDILNLGFSLNVLITPKNKDGKKIDLNDILKSYGKEKAKEIWKKFIKTAEPYIVFAIKQEIKEIQELNPLTTELKKCKIMQKYLKLDFIDPNERWILEQYFKNHGYPTTNEFFKYADIHFSKQPELEGNKLICFVGQINKELENNLKESDKKYNVIDIKVKTDIYNIDKSVEVILITNTEFLFRTKKIAQKLIKNGNKVRIFYSHKELKSAFEYMFALNKAVDYDKFLQDLVG